MRPGLYFDLRNPAPWRRDWAVHYARSLELAEEVDRLGVGSIWTSEHHHFDDGYLPQPLTFLAAVAARTRRARLGTAVLLAPLRHPLHVAEQAAIVDLVSGGRLELGLGPGYRADEFEHFDRDRSHRHAATDDAVCAIRRLWRDGVATPPPVQSPVPMWLGYSGPLGAQRAGRVGAGLLSAGRRVLEPYLHGLREGGHDPSTARMATPIFWVLATDPERAMARLRPHYEHQWRTYRDGGRPSQRGDLAVALDAMTAPGPGGTPPMLQAVTPGDAAAQLRAMFDGLPVEHILFWASIAGMPDDLVDEHVRLVSGDLNDALSTAASTSESM